MRIVVLVALLIIAALGCQGNGGANDKEGAPANSVASVPVGQTMRPPASSPASNGVGQEEVAACAALMNGRWRGDDGTHFSFLRAQDPLEHSWQEGDQDPQDWAVRCEGSDIPPRRQGDPGSVDQDGVGEGRRAGARCPPALIVEVADCPKRYWVLAQRPPKPKPPYKGLVSKRYVTWRGPPQNQPPR